MVVGSENGKIGREFRDILKIKFNGNYDWLDKCGKWSFKRERLRIIRSFLDYIILGVGVIIY